MSSEEDNAEPDIGQVLRSAGRRPDPPEEAMRSVRPVVEAQWREAVALRSRRRRLGKIGMSVAAAVVLATVALSLYSPLVQTAGEKMADVSVVVGSAQKKSGAWSRWQPVSPHQPLQVGEVIATAADGRVALQLAAKLSLRLDHDTRVVLTDARHIRLERGAVYLDSSGSLQPEEQRLQVITPVGAVRHVGTQYEARIVGTGVRIAVREGEIELETSVGADAGGSADVGGRAGASGSAGAGGSVGATQRAAAGEQMMISPAGAVQRSPIGASDPSWQWAAAIAPEFNIDGRPLAEFLTWAARELGREVVFANPASEAEASRVLLSGSIAGLTPEDALAAVLPTTPLRGELRNGKLIVTFNNVH